MHWYLFALLVGLICGWVAGWGVRGEENRRYKSPSPSPAPVTTGYSPAVAVLAPSRVQRALSLPAGGR